MGRASYLLGQEGEARAKAYLLNLGFTIVECNFHSRFGEIDIIARKDGVLHFIEVKSSEGYDPRWAITPKKMQKILKTIDFYLLKTGLQMPYEVDALMVEENGCELFCNITII